MHSVREGKRCARCKDKVNGGGGAVKNVEVREGRQRSMPRSTKSFVKFSELLQVHLSGCQSGPPSVTFIKIAQDVGIVITYTMAVYLNVEYSCLSTVEAHDIPILLRPSSPTSWDRIV